MTWLEPLQIPLIRQAFWGIIIAGASLSLLGVLVVPLKLTGLRFTLMHVGLLGAALSLSLGLNPTLGAFLLIMLTSVVMGSWGDRMNLSANAISGLFMTGSLALAFLVLAQSGVPAMEAFGIFAGSVLLLGRLDLWLVAILGGIILLVFTLAYREIQLILVDRDLAHTLGVPVQAIRLLMYILLGASVSLALRLVGALLVDAILLLPAMAVLPWARGLRSALLLTSLVGVACTAGGFLLALAFDLPVGASVALLGSLAMGISILLQRRRLHS